MTTIQEKRKGFNNYTDEEIENKYQFTFFD